MCFLIALQYVKHCYLFEGITRHKINLFTVWFRVSSYLPFCWSANNPSTLCIDLLEIFKLLWKNFLQNINWFEKKWFRLIAVIKNHIKFSLLPECFVLQVLVPLNVLVRSVNISFFDLGSLKFLRNFRYHYFHYCNCQSYRVVLMIFISKTVRIKR